MKKGYIIASVACLIVAVAVTAIFGFLINKENPLEDSSYLFAIEESAGHYLKDNTSAKLSSNSDWAKALQRTDYDKFDVDGNPSTLELDDIISDDMKFVTPGGQEIIFTKADNGTPKVSAPGPDGEAGTGDDVTSSSFRDSMNL